MSESSYSVTELALLLGAETVTSDYLIDGIGTLESATETQLSFLHNSRYQSQVSASAAGAILVTEAHRKDVQTVALVVDDPYLAYARATALFANNGRAVSQLVSPSAVISSDARVAADAVIGPHVVIGERVTIASGVVIEANCVIGTACSIGENTRLAANVTLYSDIEVGKDCLIHSGAVIGADGFGFANSNGDWVKIHQLGGVNIGDDVEIGAGTTIDRGALDDTVIGNGVILDNQIQIGHNTIIGDHTAVAACTAIAGSTRIGKRCTIAGACAIAGHLTIVEGTHITGMSMVSRSILQPGAYSSGTAAEPHQQWKRNAVRFRQLDEMSRRIKKLEKTVKQQNIEGQP
ncbi:UDP-3-O-(3-hydroxymyristoyl)glucosamine N-acyltransferase [Amphritea japonica]|uniref:UDP-3-O-acylglucosamine N-acyltransferase n=1 Tax=Amphritea japonica ATCC BAA-1530 TaxID=1278309 RepID=A0A7R6SRD7_9GAMM|nr:UDP-3-O-(3-hydroxymyristoyl)glucosamine N-acyltransferase [Amphritea japonica]BBB25081.1 UDP-3-O-[3-hydroxymyristoyl] glucosamine N-acyltransferase [Amphritea japonica ATCC BAA-1530]